MPGSTPETRASSLTHSTGAWGRSSATTAVTQPDANASATNACPSTRPPRRAKNAVPGRTRRLESTVTACTRVASGRLASGVALARALPPATFDPASAKRRVPPDRWARSDKVKERDGMVGRELCLVYVVWPRSSSRLPRASPLAATEKHPRCQRSLPEPGAAHHFVSPPRMPSRKGTIAWNAELGRCAG